MEEISIWLRDFITELRKQSDKLSQDERSKISNLDDFFPPCQVLLLWFKDVNLQYLICTHDDNRDDLEIEVEGPIPTYEAIDKLDAILQNPKWNRTLSEKEKKHIYSNTVAFPEILEGVFLNLLNMLRDYLFQKPPANDLVGVKMMLISRDFWWDIRGNITGMDKAKMITEILEQAKQEIARLKTAPSTPPPSVPPIKSCATYFYPPIWVGQLPKRTFQQKARGSFIFPEKALELEYKGRILIITQDGLIAISEENVPKATKMLNEIMATFLLMGLEANAIRELEVGPATIDSTSKTMTSWGTRTQTLRTQLAFHFRPTVDFESRIEISKEDFTSVVQQAKRISDDPEISDFLKFLLEAHTHLRNSEYSQSFIMSWVIVERQMYWLWKKFLKEEQMPRERRDKLTNPVYWTIDFVLEGLNLGGQLPNKEYEELMSLKSKRNDIIHAGESVTLEETEKCFKLATSIVKQRSGLN